MAEQDRLKPKMHCSHAAFRNPCRTLVGGLSAAAKHGVIGMTKSAALEYAARGIQINAICPGIIDTPMMGRFSGGTPEGRHRVIDQEPIGRMGTPEEIALAVLWLCSGLGGFAIGHALVVDGGQTVGI